MDELLINELVEYPAKALQKIGTDKTVVGLLLDDPDVDMDSDEADEVFDQYLFDYLYVDNTTTEARAYVCVETELFKTPSPTIQDFHVYVTIICHKRFMKMDASKFTGMIGNRRDNIARAVNKLLDGSEAFGIGALVLESVKTIGSPPGFTVRELTYRVADFVKKK